MKGNCRLSFVLLTSVSLFPIYTSASAITFPDSTRKSNNIGRISQQKCETYKWIYQEVFYNPIPPPFGSTFYGKIKCPNLGSGFIHGGKDSRPDELPHMAALGYNVTNSNSGKSEISYRCAGTLISDQFVLTAAHCLINRKLKAPVHVLLGDINLRGGSLVNKRRQIINVETVIIHPRYRQPSTYHDIALIKLEKKIDLPFNRSAIPRPSIRPACLPSNDHISVNQVVDASGWGINDDGIQKDTLQVVNLTVQPNEVCNDIYSGFSDFSYRFSNGKLSQNQLCVGSLTGDTCQGDSGGPLTIPLKEMACMHYVVGITSTGAQFCGLGIPAVYISVKPYLSWIENIVWPNS